MSTKDRGEETRARLREAAQECFSQQGYDGASVAEICRCAGVSKGAFYHHFSSKHALFLELLDWWLGGIDQQLAAARIEAVTVPDAILGMAEQVGAIFHMADEYVPIFMEFYSKASRDPIVWKATIEPYRRYRDFFAQLIQLGIDEGSISPTDPDMTARVFLSLAVGLLLQGLLSQEEEDWAQVAYEGVRVLLRGLNAKVGRA